MLRGEVTQLSAVDVSTPDLGDAESKMLSEKIGTHRIIVLGTDESGGVGQARAIAWALSLPTINRAPQKAEWIAAALAAFLALWQLRFHRFGVLIFGGGAAAGALGLALVFFQSTLIWCPPVLPLVMLACSTLFCLVWPRTRTIPGGAADPAVN